MPKLVLDVGQCPPDHAAIRVLIEQKFAAKVCQAQLPEDALESLRSEQFDLVLVNRKLDADYTDGLEIIKQIKSEDQLRDTPCMLITNFAEHQEAALAAGAELGFGKDDLASPETVGLLAKYLGPAPA